MIVETILGKAVIVQVDGYLLVLHPAHRHATHAGDAAQTILQEFHIVIQLTIRLVLTLQGDEQGGGVAEVVHHLHGQHILRQLRLELGYPVLELAPESVLVLEVVVQLHLDVDNAVAALREGFLLPDLLVGEDVFLQGLGHLLHHLLYRVARRHGHHDALADGEVGKLVLTHLGQAVDAEGHEAGHAQDDDLPVVHGRFHEVALPFHKATSVPSQTF